MEVRGDGAGMVGVECQNEEFGFILKTMGSH